MTELRDEISRRPVARHRVLHDGAVFDLVSDTVDFAPGVRFEREYLRHPGAVAVLAVDDQDRVLLIRQYRHPAGGTLWEIPAGLLDIDGEAPHLAAARELREETDHEADHLEVLLDLRPSPGGSDEVIRVYLATGIREVAPGEREDEEAEIEHRWVPLRDAITGVLEGRLTNGTLAAAVLALAARRGSAQGLTPRPADVPLPERPGRED
ncbi:NUDIX hydrolase [Brachybacterium sp. EF45031]|uniref:NUDIX domain-containing protein n=1 Tax=Brachybacterium sillae TaxID=2810536 RepID=UPI00217CD0B5|nr:NUDIX hydrolase [Brachybacterium sillae]MCS6712685.1 NUDIX hydrolase [Brachybacterium sillae]